MPLTPLRPASLHFNNQDTVVSRDFNDIYFSRHDGLAEARHVFLHGNQLPARFIHHNRPLFIVAETGFGCGLNFLALCQAFHQFRAANPQARLQRLHVISIEKHPLTAADLRQAHAYWQELAEWAKPLQQQWILPVAGCHRLLFAGGQITLDLWLGDVNQILRQPDASLWQQVDAWFLDGFAPAKNPDMWRDELFQTMAQLTRTGGSVATFSAAGMVRRGLQQAGFHVEKRQGFARKRHMLTATLPQAINCPPPPPWYQRIAASSTTHIAIIGGGIASAMLALALSRRGVAVTLYCADADIAQGASGNRQGVMYPSLNPHDEALTRFSLAAFGFARRLYDSLPVSVEHDWCGVLQLASTAASQKKIRQMLQMNPPAALAYAPDSQQASAAGLPINQPGILYPAAGWINPAQLTRAALHLAQQHGVHIHYQHHAVRLVYQPDGQYSGQHNEQYSGQHSGQPGWQIHFANGNCRQHPVLVLANGWQISQFSQTADLPVTPAAGQVSHIPTTPVLAKLRQVLCFDGYFTPHNPANGQHCLGASYHHYQTDTRYCQQDQQDNRQRLIHSLAGQSWTQQIDISASQARSAVRCLIRDHLPLVGNAPDYQATLALAQHAGRAKHGNPPASVPSTPYHQDLFILAALGSRGLCSAPLAAEILAAQITGEPLPLDSATLNALNPNRLWIRKLLKGRKVNSHRLTRDGQIAG